MSQLNAAGHRWNGNAEEQEGVSPSAGRHGGRFPTGGLTSAQAAARAPVHVALLANEKAAQPEERAEGALRGT
jgi:hypothetical protein